MLAVFMQIMPRDKPTYYGNEGTIAIKGLNPGLGFRPHINFENSLISYNPSVEDGKDGYKKFAQNLENFLGASKYSKIMAFFIYSHT